MRYFVRDEGQIVGPLEESAMRRYLAESDPKRCAYREEHAAGWIEVTDTSPGKQGASTHELPPHGLSISGAVIVAISFFLPWIETGCGTLSGADLTRISGEFWLVLVVAAIAVGAAAMRVDLRESAPRIAVSGSAGGVMLLLISKAASLPGVGVNQFSQALRVGAYGTILGLWLIVLTPFLSQPRRVPPAWEERR